jgi:branched-chain amino acid transport system substrate-binding protein
MFATVPLIVDQYAVVMRYFRLRGWTKIAFITATDAAGLESERDVDALAALPENKSITITNHERMALADLSVTAQIERIKAAGAQAIISGSIGTPFQTILRGIRDAGLDLPVAGSAGNLSYRQMEAFASSLPRGNVYVPGFPVYAPEVIAGNAPIRKVVDRFSSAMKAEGIAKPEIGYVTAWETGNIVIDALRRRGANASAKQLHAYITELRGLTGLFGPLDFKATPQNGTTKDWVMLLRWDPAGTRFVGVSRPGGEPL